MRCRRTRPVWPVPATTAPHWRALPAASAQRRPHPVPPATMAKVLPADPAARPSRRTLHTATPRCMPAAEPVRSMRPRAATEPGAVRPAGSPAGRPAARIGHGAKAAPWVPQRSHAAHSPRRKAPPPLTSPPPPDAARAARISSAQAAPAVYAARGPAQPRPASAPRERQARGRSAQGARQSGCQRSGVPHANLGSDAQGMGAA